MFLLWVPVAVIAASFLEYAAHRWLMHRLIAESIWFRHTRLHHGKYYRTFNREDDQEGKYVNLTFGWPITFFFLLLLSPIYFLSWEAGLVFSAVAVVHNRLWDLFHSEMHLESGKFFAQWRLFKFLKWHHFLHHRHVSKNYNAVIPLADYVLRTVAVPSEADLRAWEAIHVRH